MDFQLPECYICPITREVFYDPVITEDGYTYERYAIEDWFKKHDTSPFTGMKLQTKILIPNIALKNALQHHFTITNDNREFYYQSLHLSKHIIKFCEDNITIPQAKYIICGNQYHYKLQDVDKITIKLEESVKEGCIKSESLLAYVYRKNGDNKKAFILNKHAANLGEPRAQYNLAVEYEETYNDIKQVMKYYELSAAQNCISALLSIGMAYHFPDYGYKLDYNKAIEMYKKILEREYNVIATFYLGVLTYKYIDKLQGIDIIMNGVNNNEINCQHFLGLVTLESNKRAAINYFKAAANNGHHKAYHKLGMIYYEDKDYKTALSYLLEANKHKFNVSFEIARCYLYEPSIRDFKKSFEYNLKASENYKTHEPTHNVAIMYLTGTGVDVDKEKARNLFKMTSKKYKCEYAKDALTKIDKYKCRYIIMGDKSGAEWY